MIKLLLEEVNNYFEFEKRTQKNIEQIEDSQEVFSEAFGGSALANVVKNIAKILARRQSTTPYYNVDLIFNLKSKNKNLKSTIIDFENKKRIRLNWLRTSQDSYAIYSVTFWRKGPGSKPVVLITKDLNIVQILNAAEKILKGAKKVEVDDNAEDINSALKKKFESEEIHGDLITEDDILNIFDEAKRVKDNEILDMMKGRNFVKIERPLLKSGRKAIGTFDFIKKNGGKVTIHYGNSVTVSMNTLFDDLKKAGGDLDKLQADINKNYAGATRSNSALNVFKAPEQETLEVEESPAAKAFDKLIEEASGEGATFERIDAAVANVKKGKTKALLITGDPGIGKSFTVKKAMKGLDHEFIKGGVSSATALYRKLFAVNKKDRIIVFDDTDSILEDKDAVNILKAALDTTDNEVSWESSNTIHPFAWELLQKDIGDIKVGDILKLKEAGVRLMPIEIKDSDKVAYIKASPETRLSAVIKDGEELKPTKRWQIMQEKAQLPPADKAALLPSKFSFIGKIIFISNKYQKDIPDAIKSRTVGNAIEVDLDLSEIVSRIKKVAPSMEMEGVSNADRMAAIKFMEKTVIPSGRIRKCDFRTFTGICINKSTGSPHWKAWAAASLQDAFGTKMKGGDKR